VSESGYVVKDAFVVKDSGERQQFESGMVRDTQAGKLDWWRLLIGPMARRLVAHVTKGAVKYPDVKPGVPNWTLAAGEQELARFKASAFRHFIQWYEGDVDEDHAAAVHFNINGAEYVKEKLAKPAPCSEVLVGEGKWARRECSVCGPDCVGMAPAAVQPAAPSPSADVFMQFYRKGGGR